MWFREVLVSRPIFACDVVGSIANFWWVCPEGKQNVVLFRYNAGGKRDLRF